jgi:SAM-dependent methyltransferase
MMKDKVLMDIVSCMAVSEQAFDIQRVQTEHRIRLAEFWEISKGMKVLEIGCGQGDTTAVLAYYVGQEGFVNGVDIGPEDYGAPITVGEAASYLKESMLGKQIKMEYRVDVLDSKIDFPENYFDVIVLSHCSWYMKSSEELGKILNKARNWGRKLCFAEWDTRISAIEQYPHFLAVLIQAQYESFKSSSTSNVRTLFTPMDIRRIASSSGWSIFKESVISSENMQDGKWESNMVNNVYKAELEKLDDIPDKHVQLIHSELELLNEYCRNNTIKSLSTYAFTAE